MSIRIPIVAITIVFAFGSPASIIYGMYRAWHVNLWSWYDIFVVCIVLSAFVACIGFGGWILNRRA